MHLIKVALLPSKRGRIVHGQFRQPQQLKFQTSNISGIVNNDRWDILGTYLHMPGGRYAQGDSRGAARGDAACLAPLPFRLVSVLTPNHGRRKKSGVPGGCRTSLTNKNFSVHFISIFVNVK